MLLSQSPLRACTGSPVISAFQTLSAGSTGHPGACATPAAAGAGGQPTASASPLPTVNLAPRPLFTPGLGGEEGRGGVIWGLIDARAVAGRKASLPAKVATTPWTPSWDGIGRLRQATPWSLVGAPPMARPSTVKLTVRWAIRSARP